METREEAVRWLVARGYHAFLRDWSLGQTVGVATEASEGPQGITVYGRMVYLYPVEGGRWAVADFLTHKDYLCDDLRRAAEFGIQCLENDNPRRDV
jgi:hypothetical protein